MYCIKISVPAFPLSLKIIVIPSMQLSRIRERPGVSIFQLHMDNRAGGPLVTSPNSTYGAHVLPEQGSGEPYLRLGVALKQAETFISQSRRCLL